MCCKKDKRVTVMILKSSISFLRKVFDSNMYSIRTETGDVVLHPETFSDDGIITDNEEEKQGI